MLHMYRLCAVPLTVRVRRCLRVLISGSSSKESPGGGKGRIIPKRCSVSSTLICHLLNLYCSFNGSISHIATTMVSYQIKPKIPSAPSSRGSSVHVSLHRSVLLFGESAFRGIITLDKHHYVPFQLHFLCSVCLICMIAFHS